MATSGASVSREPAGAFAVEMKMMRVSMPVWGTVVAKDRSIQLIRSWRIECASFVDDGETRISAHLQEGRKSGEVKPGRKEASLVNTAEPNNCAELAPRGDIAPAIKRKRNVSPNSK